MRVFIFCAQHAAALSAAATKLEHETSAKEALASQLAEAQAELTRAGDDAGAARVAASRDGVAARTHAEALAVAEGLAEGLRQELAASQAQLRWLEQQSAAAWASCEAAEARALAIEQGREDDAKRHARRQQQLERSRAAAAAVAQQQQSQDTDGQALSSDQRSRSASPSPAAAAAAAMAAAARLSNAAARVPSASGPALATAWSERSGFTSGVTSPRGSSRSGSRSIAEYLSEHRGSDYRGEDGGGSEYGGSEYGGSERGGVLNNAPSATEYDLTEDVNGPTSGDPHGSASASSSVASSALSPTSAPPEFVAFRASFGPGPIGLQFDVDEDAAAQNQLSLVATHASGAAAEAGVQPGDLIAEVDGEQLPDGFGANQLFDLLVSRPRPVTLGFVRQASAASGRRDGGTPDAHDSGAGEAGR